MLCIYLLIDLDCSLSHTKGKLKVGTNAYWGGGGGGGVVGEEDGVLDANSSHDFLSVPLRGSSKED